MSYILKRLDGTFEVAVKNQGGTDRADAPTYEEAVAQFRGLHSFLNGGRPEDAPIPHLIDLTAWPVLGDDHGRFEVTGDMLDRACGLALSRTKLEPGRRYEVRVSLVAKDEDPGFVGAGI